MIRKFIFGSYTYDYVLCREERKTLSLTVNPDLSILVKCPNQATEERIEKFLKKKWLWLQKQINYFKKFKRTKYHREYISGESFRYLGKQYMLQIKEDGENRVVLSKGKLVLHTAMYTSDAKYNKLLVSRWYSNKTKFVFNERFEEVLNRFDYSQKPSLGIRQMNKRWGSYLNNDKILLNPKLIEASRECIDYVITHELCHMKYKDHDKRFYKLLEQKFPKWEKTKEKLENYLG
ncbi:MAG: WLM domain protein [bacterium ADurb.Bin212]|nr:MAG: WLM domain protein [bacterium ADurb.Bin212]